MLALIARAMLSGAIVVAIAEAGKRLPAVGALVASLPLVSILGMVLLWHEKPDRLAMAGFAQATFWFVLCSLPMFPTMALLLRRGAGFVPVLLAGCALTVALYALMLRFGPRFGLAL